MSLNVSVYPGPEGWSVTVCLPAIFSPARVFSGVFPQEHLAHDSVRSLLEHDTVIGLTETISAADIEIFERG